MQRAISLARKNSQKWKLAAVGIRGGSIIGIGLNVPTKCDIPPRDFPYYNRGTHAEMACLKNCSKVPKTLYVARVTANGTPAMARPCPWCYEELMLAGIRKIVYTNAVGWGVELFR